jgi:hypothetical protein
MTDILPPAGWPNVRQLETNEFATGGANGNMNEQAKSLAARSELLKQYAALPYESKTSGYALNERVQLATGDIVRSTIPNNVNNPNVDMTGWVIPYLVKSSNLDDVPDKATARNNLDVYSQAEVDTAIASATPVIPNATETTAGKAKIATTAIAQAGVNDTDFITAKKLRDALKATGSAPIIALRASGWIEISAGVVTAFGGENIASITRVAAGKFRVTLTAPLPSNRYTVFGSAREAGATTNYHGIMLDMTATLLTTEFTFVNRGAATVPFDPPYVVFGVA